MGIEIKDAVFLVSQHNSGSKKETIKGGLNQNFILSMTVQLPLNSLLPAKWLSIKKSTFDFIEDKL